MKIYTRNGDKGETQIYADKPIRKKKSDIELNCYGTLDELNSHIGLLIANMTEHRIEIPARLANIQTALFEIGFGISAQSQLQSSQIKQLEQDIDSFTAALAPQTSFILPGGHICAAQAHICRTIARRAERELVALTEYYQVADIHLQYINRLSDYFFVLARFINVKQGVEDTPLSRS
ncbi:cob(I)yrinic acid a,c-diamide adenosyltransferase [Neptunicella marina]|uniref:Corrinoid adenosyltransferase n=1 Tax=Neptunicella marina TaxID=2125989 RepID=A0A8J6M087_9ALTE|nr:cob(I)yrinic acid a,c-diamide adenosyltransferase [Neptunicella marina]MBC3767019.1 cob(I)yrinic acid a,c-diamide adenosyltransferase [Neptunicella marina]